MQETVPPIAAAVDAAATWLTAETLTVMYWPLALREPEEEIRLTADCQRPKPLWCIWIAIFASPRAIPLKT
jgi:hypothetical protein